MLYAAQKSAFSAFRYQIFNEQHQLIGQLNLPDYPLAKNARLKSFIPTSLTSVITIELVGEVYEVAFEYLNRQWVNDIRYTLLHQGVTLSTVDVARKNMMMIQPFEAQLVKRNRFLGALYALEVNQQVVGKIYEAQLISLKRQVTIDLPNTVSLPLQAFLFFLMQNHAYG